MTIKLSTGLRNGLLDTGSFKSLLDGCKMKIYGGDVPADADASIGAATLLCTVSNDATATGLTFEAVAVGGVIVKTASEVWRGVNAVSGVATFMRLETAADDQSASTTQIRLQGKVANAGEHINLADTSLVAAASQGIDYYSIELPTA